MANASKVTTTVVTLELTGDEAGALLKAMNNVGGTFQTGRKYTENIASALVRAGVTPIGRMTGAVYFE